MFRSRAEDYRVCAGATFRRTAGWRVETAEVLAVHADDAGIPHVRYALAIAGPGGVTRERRTLALDAFRRLFGRPVAMA